ncbi:MAG: MSEP-CTERM sorting domain-containing protein, partial [Aestuariibacter sp.]|nr:MSEP-CTERM sorting domain-containing protein [Aestuariibacter sp.]
MSDNRQLLNKSKLQSTLWFILAPQATLIALNIYAWDLVGGEANREEAGWAAAILFFEVSMLITSFAVYWFCRKGSLTIGRSIMLISLTAHIAYMWFFLTYVGHAIPSNIQLWILDAGNVWRWNITLSMPGAFVSLFAFSKEVYTGIKSSRGRLISLGISIAAPLIWYLFVVLMQPTWSGQYRIWGGIVFSSIMVTVFLGAMIVLFDSLVHKKFTSKMVEKHYILVLLLGFAMPLGGLYFNRIIPFPVDFQSTGVYLLTVFNGLILSLKPGGTYLSLKLFLRCVCLPFTLYFFIVFLPFLPISLFAVFAAGAGFLILTPLVLGMFQMRITLADYKTLRDNTGKQKALALALTGFLVLPGGFVAEAVLEKNALNTVLDYFYTHDFDDSPPTEHQLSSAKKALVQLRDRKLGIQLPYISGLYNATVFGGMVLSDKKIAQSYRWLSNDKLPEYKASLFARGNSFSGRRLLPDFSFVAPERNVTVSNIEQASVHDNKTTLRLALQNQTDARHSLFVGRLKIPEGVFVSGLRLKIDGDWVSGKVFDKKTALWVFQKITEVRRDPAIIYYRSPDTAELRVYP